jgi:hypothetical protein
MKINKKSGILPPNHYLHALYTKKTKSLRAKQQVGEWERSKIACKQLLCTFSSRWFSWKSSLPIEYWKSLSELLPLA